MMPLSPDECKWSARLGAMQQGMRCRVTSKHMSEKYFSACYVYCRKKNTKNWATLNEIPLSLQLWPLPQLSEHPTGRHADPLLRADEWVRSSSQTPTTQRFCSCAHFASHLKKKATHSELKSSNTVHVLSSLASIWLHRIFNCHQDTLTEESAQF